VAAVSVTTDEAAEIAGVSTRTIFRWVLAGDLEPVRRGAKPLRFHYDDVARVQRAKRTEGWRRRHAEARWAWVARTQGDLVSR